MYEKDIITIPTFSISKFVCAATLNNLESSKIHELIYINLLFRNNPRDHKLQISKDDATD